MSERYVVIGSNSFSGSHFVSKLMNNGHEVLGISRSPEIEIVFRPYDWQSSEGSFSFRQIDINNVAGIDQALNDFRPDFVVNFAAQSMVAQSWHNPEHWYRTNVLGLVELAKILERLPNLVRYVHVTTPEVYGSTDGWVKESRCFSPSTPYAISRAAGDMHLFAMFESRGLPVTFTRAANVYGPGQQTYRIVPRTFLAARLRRRLTLEGGGWSTRSFIHISDVAEATYLISQSGVSGQAYHISTDEIISIRGLVERACELTGTPFGELVDEGPARPGHDNTYMLDSSLIRADFGWKPIMTLDEGLQNTLAWVDNNVGKLSTATEAYIHKE
jgi:dTDP-glucose 4,6-dehydratase